MNHYARIVLRTNFTKKDGTHPITLRLTFNRKVKYISLNKSVPADKWDTSNAMVKETHPDAGTYNLNLKALLKRANDIILDYEIQNKPLSFGDFENEFKNQKTSCYYTFVERELEKNKLTASYSLESMRTYETELTKLKRFKKTLNFNEITVSFLESYEGYMRNKLLNKTNTIHKSLKCIRGFINKAIRQDLIKENIFYKYRLRTEAGNREYLSKNEFEELKELLNKNIPKYCKSSLRIFLFGCYTGLRYQDIKRLTFENIEGDMIKIQMHKTKDYVTIPLIEKAKQLITSEKYFENQKIFKVPTNQVINRYIKEAVAQTSIKKTITFHCSRHTFATHGISLGIPMEVVSKLLGHKSIKTTQIYAKVVDDVKIREMQKWQL